MPHLTTAPVATARTASVPRPASCAPHKNAPVLITEAELLLSTAAAVPAPSARRHWPSMMSRPRLERMLTAFAQPRPHCPRREPVYFETARMARAMDRL